MRIKNLFPQLFSFGDRASALWAGHSYALARTALRQELAGGGGISLLSPDMCLMWGVVRCHIAACLLVLVHITV